MKLMFVKSLFIPKHSFIDINIESIDAFIKYFRTINNKFSVIIINVIGWISEIDDADILRKYIDKMKIDLIQTNISLNLKLWESNYGKCHIFQNITSLYCLSKNTYGIEDFDYVLYADHDISPIDDILTDRFIVGSFIGDETEHIEIGMLSFCQEPDNRHNETIFRNSIKFNEKTYYYHHDNIRVATGCFITTPKILLLLSSVVLSTDKKHKDNDIFDGVYGEEDIAIGEILNVNKFYNIVSSLRVNHPFCTDSSYNKWKEERLFKCALDKHTTALSLTTINI